MKIAIVGKGGSGKSTVCSMIIQYLIKEYTVRAIDADINMHLAPLLGIDVNNIKALSETENTQKIIKHLIGNRNIPENHFIKTTPPGKNSGFMLFETISKIIPHGIIKKTKKLCLSYVGTYTKEGIGTSCYHSQLSILENILSHTITKEKEHIVLDMVAGTDAFSNTLFLQADIIFFIVEPTNESIAVGNMYKDLAKEGNIEEKVFFIGNKCEDNQDEEFISKYFECLGYLSYSRSIKTQSQKNEPITYPKERNKSIKNIIKTIKEIIPDNNKTLKKMHQIHKEYIQKPSIKNRLGDLSYQIEEDFNYKDPAL